MAGGTTTSRARAGRARRPPRLRALRAARGPGRLRLGDTRGRAGRAVLAQPVGAPPETHVVPTRRHLAAVISLTGKEHGGWIDTRSGRVGQGPTSARTWPAGPLSDSREAPTPMSVRQRFRRPASAALARSGERRVG